jgi:DNA-binding response OmpR family regulator
MDENELEQAAFEANDFEVNDFEVDKERVLVVDDDAIICEVLEMALGEHFEVKSVNSGEDCLQVIGDFQPKLVILDIEMAGIDGYETCRMLRESGNTVPVIFQSSRDSLSERLEAFDSGGDDFLTKPVDCQIVLRKTEMAIKARAERDSIAGEKASFEQMAMAFLDSMGDSGVLQNYTRENFNCPDHATLLENTMQATRNLGLECHIQLRFSGGVLSVTPAGRANPLEESVISQVSSMGRLFQFKKRLVTNYEHITIIIMNMPDSDEVAGRIRDNIAILAEIADEFVKGISLRLDSAANIALIRQANETATAAIKSLQNSYREQQIETRMLQNELIDEVEKSYSYLGLTAEQENSVSQVMKVSSDKILKLFEHGEEFEKQFAIILRALTPKISH